MEVGGGTEAQSVYLEMIAASTSPSQKKKLRQCLIEYCTKDTMGMVGLVDWLFKSTKATRLVKKDRV
jgi:hypothetical protein